MDKRQEKSTLVAVPDAQIRAEIFARPQKPEKFLGPMRSRYHRIRLLCLRKLLLYKLLLDQVNRC